MNAAPSLLAYLARDSALRWKGRTSLPLARVLVATGLAVTALLILASFALGISTLETRIAQFGLDALVVRTPLRRTSDPTPTYPDLAHYGRTLTLVLPPASARLDGGRQVPIAVATDATLRELAALGVRADQLPIVLSTTLPSGMPVRASVGPWSVSAVTATPTSALQPLDLSDLLVVRAGDFPMQATLPGAALTLLVRRPTAPSLEALTGALTTVFANAPPNREGAATVKSALPWLRELATLQATWRRYAAWLGLILAVTVAVVFGSGAILEYEATAYTTALLRSFGVRRLQLWFQRYLEAAVLANLGGVLGAGGAYLVAQVSLPSLASQIGAPHVIIPVLAALNVGAVLASIPVGLALRRPVGLILQ